MRIEDLDPAIRDLVIWLNRVPGITTWSSCQGHADDEDSVAHVSLIFQDLGTLGTFSDLLEFVTSDSWADSDADYPILDVRLEIDLQSHLGEGLPIPADLVLAEFPSARVLLPPTPQAILRFAEELGRRITSRWPSTGPAPVGVEMSSAIERSSPVVGTCDK